MSLRKKTSIERQKQTAEANFSARIEFLKGEGWDSKRIQRDAKIRQFGAEKRKAIKRLAAIADSQALTAQMAEVKAMKTAAPKDAPRTKTKVDTATPKRIKPKRKPVESADE